MTITNKRYIKKGARSVLIYICIYKYKKIVHALPKHNRKISYIFYAYLCSLDHINNLFISITWIYTFLSFEAIIVSNNLSSNLK